MSKNKLKYMLVAAVLFAGAACKKELQVGNPNQPTIGANVNSLSGLEALAQGATFINGFVDGDGWLGNSYFSLPYGYSELLADVVGADAANQAISVISVPDNVTYGSSQTLTNPSPQIPFIRSYNTRANTGAGNNVLYYQWLNGYALNNAENAILSYASSISSLTSDEVKTFQAWAYWWKGYAYAEIGTQYYSGLIVDTYGGASNNYQTHDVIIARSNYYLALAATTLASISNTADYTSTLTALIPTQFQAGNGGVPTVAQWTRNINTMLARNILLNKLNPFVNGVVGGTISKSSTTAMTSTDWNSVLNYAKNGIQQGDVVFTGHSGTVNPVFSAGGGTVSALTTGTNTNTTFKITERYTQFFGAGDARLNNNFSTATLYNNPNFTTRYSLVSGGNGAPGVAVLGNLTPGAYEVFIGPSFEENELMLAEANIMLGNTDQGLAYVDAVRTYQGAGVPKVSGTGLTQAKAMAQLTAERRVALAFRGVSWYDSRRWGWSYATSNGGGFYNGVFLTVGGTVYNNATISYNFLDYWDVPADESVLNPPGSGSAATVNPNF